MYDLELLKLACNGEDIVLMPYELMTTLSLST